MKFIKLIKAENNISKINKFLFRNDMPESIYTRQGLLRNLRYYIEDAYTKNEKLQRIKDAEQVKKESYKFYVIEETGHFTGYMTLNEAIEEVIKDYKNLYEGDSDKIENFIKEINKFFN